MPGFLNFSRKTFPAKHLVRELLWGKSAGWKKFFQKSRHDSRVNRSLSMTAQNCLNRTDRGKGRTVSRCPVGSTIVMGSSRGHKGIKNASQSWGLSRASNDSASDLMGRAGRTNQQHCEVLLCAGLPLLELGSPARTLSQQRRASQLAQENHHHTHHNL